MITLKGHYHTIIASQPQGTFAKWTIVVKNEVDLNIFVAGVALQCYSGLNSDTTVVTKNNVDMVILNLKSKSTS